MKKILAIVGAAAVCCKLGNIRCYAWEDVTHIDILKKALKLLEIEKKQKIATFYNKYYKQLESGCTAPDESGDIDHGAGMHYYSCCDPNGKKLLQTNGYYKDRLGRFLPSARTLFEQNYTSAVSLYKSGKKSEAMTCFARAIHFISDMGCPVHVANIRYFEKKGNIHYEFERHAKAACSVYTAQTSDRRLSKYYEKDTFQDALNKLVNYSAKFVKSVRSLDPLKLEDIESETLIHTQQNVMALMVRFYNDCMTDNGYYINGSKASSFKSEYSGLFLTVTDKGLTLSEKNKDLQQKLTVSWNDDGSFCLKATDDRLVAKSLKGLVKSDAKQEPAKFRAICTGKRRFMITVGSKDYKMILDCSKSGKLTMSKLDPKKPTYHWIIN